MASAPVTSRITFTPAFAYAIRIRGLTLTELARRAHVSLARTSAAAHCRQVNITTALRLAKVVSASPIVAELEEWTESPDVGADTDGDSAPPTPPDARPPGSGGGGGRRSRPPRGR
jgi:hypothetical protein